LRTGTEYNLPMLIHLAEHVGLGLDGRKSQKRRKQLARPKR
jgi:hypothetical protein